MRNREGSRGLTTVLDSDGKHWQNFTTPMSDFSETRTSSVLDPERNERGEEGGLREVLMAINCEGFNGIGD
jgi:hypothetical protein